MKSKIRFLSFSNIYSDWCKGIFQQALIKTYLLPIYQNSVINACHVSGNTSLLLGSNNNRTPILLVMYVISGQNYRFMSCQRQFWWKDVNSFPPSLSSCLCMEYTIDNVITWQCLNTLNLFLLLCSFFTNASNTSNCVVQRWMLFQQNRLTFRNKLQKFTHTHTGFTKPRRNTHVKHLLIRSLSNPPTKPIIINERAASAVVVHRKCLHSIASNINF